MEIELAAMPILGYLLASVRITVWMLLVPPYSTRNVPPIAKIVLALGLAFAAAPTAGTQVPVDTAGFVFEVALQAAIGASMGFIAYMLITAVTAAGALIDIFGGFALSNAYDPLSLQSNTIFGKFYQMLFVVLLFSSGGYLILLGGLIKSFEFLPLGQVPDLQGVGPSMVITAFSTFFLLAFQLALPMIAILIVADIGLALLTKISPQLNALGFMFPAKIGLVLLCVGLSFPILPDAVDRIVELITQSASTLSGGDG